MAQPVLHPTRANQPAAIWRAASNGQTRSLCDGLRTPLRTDLSRAAAIQIMPAGETSPDVMDLGPLEGDQAAFAEILVLIGRSRVS